MVKCEMQKKMKKIESRAMANQLRESSRKKGLSKNNGKSGKRVFREERDQQEQCDEG